jgi:hypothetical protein
LNLKNGNIYQIERKGRIMEGEEPQSFAHFDLLDEKLYQLKP